MIRLFKIFLTTLVAVFFVAGCAQKQVTVESLAAMTPAERTATLLQQPQVDDIYSGNVGHFSEFNFGSGGDAFGLMRVISVTNDTVVVVTESAAWPAPEGSVEELQGDFSDITWDFDEEITIQRADLKTLHQESRILEARRLTASEIKKYLD